MNNDDKKSSLSSAPSLSGRESKSFFSDHEHDYGMPNFAFPEDDVPGSYDRKDPPKDTIAEVEASLDIPLAEGTGWESGESVSLASISDKSGMVTDEPEIRIGEDFNEEPTLANVMPFPGSTIPRSSEPEPSEMLRGAEDTVTDDLLGEPEVSYGVPLGKYEADYEPDDDDEPDSIADAVQSALKNVYGNDGHGPAPVEPSVPEFGQFSVAESLRQDAAAQAAAQGAYWDDEESTSRDIGGHDVESETVLDYLYSNRRAGPERLQEQHTPPDDYSGYGATNLDSGAVYFDPERDIRRADYDEYEEDPDWAPPSFVTSSTPPAQPGHYPAPMPTAPSPESLAVGTPDSSHLLGAAGLGLIGGIALAGVLAVFVFNSFVDENEQPLTATLSTPKVVDRLAGEGNSGATVINSPGALETAIPGPNVPPVQPDTRSAALQQPVAVQPAPVIAPPPEKPLNAFDVAGRPGTEIALNIKLSEEASKEAALISLKGLDENCKLSTGIDVGAGQWLLPPARLDTLTVTAPESLTGTFDIEVQLLKDDAQTPMSDPVTFKLTIGQAPQQTERAETPAPTQVASLGETDIPALTETEVEASQLLEVTESTPEIDTDPLTQLLIRDGNKLMREGDILGARRLYEQAAANGNPEAALAMGRSYDPSYFEKLPVQTGKPDPATAFQWYKQALDGGLVTARVKIDGLKQWLQN